MNDPEPTWRSLKPEHVPAVVSLFAVIAAYFYFAGSQYLDAKARALGLAGDPGDAAFQKTTALGAMVVFTSPVFAITFIVSLLFLGFHLVAARNRLSRLHLMEGELDATSNSLDDFGERLDAIREEVDAFDSSGGSEDDIERKLTALEVEKRRIRRTTQRFKRRLRWTRLSKRLPGALELSAIVAILGTFLGGAFEGDRAATDLKRDVVGDCELCLRYAADGLIVDGRAAFQTHDGIFVLGRSGLTLFRLDKGLRVSGIPAVIRKAEHEGKSSSPKSPQPVNRSAGHP